MANREFHQIKALEKELKIVHAAIAIGGTGAPTLATSSIGISSVTRTSQGLYKIVLKDSYNSLKMVKAIHLNATEQDLNFQVKSETVATSSDPAVNLFCLTGATATDPASGSILYVEIILKNTSVI
jgi:hypothetical protein